MPTYKYKCDGCAEEFAVQQSIHDSALTVCKKCQGNLTRIFGTVGVSFKGTGFYKTDNTAPPKAD